MLTELKYWLFNFLPYSIESWTELLGHYNRILWPFSLSVLPLMIGIVWLSGRQSVNNRRFALWLLACCWLWASLVFLRGHFATLNWAAGYVSWLFVTQALLLVIYSITENFRNIASEAVTTRWDNAIVIAAFIALPLTQLLSGYKATQLGWFALTPDATALATLALLGSMRYLPKVLVLIPLIWSILVFAISWPLDDSAGMTLLPLSVMLLLLDHFRHKAPQAS